jgi:hypothetical protein
VKGRLGIVPGANAQAAVAAVRVGDAARSGARPARLLTAVGVVAAADDHGQLLPMVDGSLATTGQPIGDLLVDGGDHDVATVAACAARGPVRGFGRSNSGVTTVGSDGRPPR